MIRTMPSFYARRFTNAAPPPSGGLPTGMQIVGRRFNDADVLEIAPGYERILPWVD